MGMFCIESFNKEYNLDNTLKKKKKGRNYDRHVKDMDNYIEMENQIEINKSKLEETINKSKKLREKFEDSKQKFEEKSKFEKQKKKAEQKENANGRKIS